MMMKSSNSRIGNWILIKIVALFLVTVELSESRPPALEVERTYGRTLRPNKPKRTRGGLSPSWVPPPVIPIVEEPVTTAETEDTSASSVGEVKQWLELDTVPSARVSAKLHSEVVLECVAVGSPPPIVFWLKDGKPIESLPLFDSEELLNGLDAQVQSAFSGFAMSKIKSKLPLRCIRPEDEGEYTCVATQIDGPIGSGPRRLSSSSKVVIDEDDKSEDWKPECEFRLPPFMYNGKKGRRGTPAYIHAAESLHMEVIGNSIVLPCRGGGIPNPRVQWYGTDGERIHIGKKYKVNSKGDLIIRNLSWTEMGDYRCNVENTYGAESSSTFLYPLLVSQRTDKTGEDVYISYSRDQFPVLDY